MTHPLGNNLSFQQQQEWRFYGSSLLYILVGYSVTALMALLFQGRVVYGLADLALGVFMVWVAMGVGTWLIYTFTERRLQLMCSMFLQAAPVGILCGPLVKVVPTEFLLSGLLAVGTLMMSACIIGLMLPVGSYRFLPFWLGIIMLVFIVVMLEPFSRAAAQTPSGALAYATAMLLALVTISDSNRAKSAWYLSSMQSSRIQAIMWLDSTNALRHLYEKLNKN